MALSQDEINEMVTRYQSQKEGLIGGEEVTFSEAQRMRTLRRTQTQAREQQSTFMSRTFEGLKQRGGAIAETFKKTYRGEISPLEFGVRIVGDVAGGVLDIVGAAIEPALMPAIEKIAETEIGAKAFQALGRGMESYEAWKAESSANARVGKMLESVVNIADIVGLGVAGKAGKILVKKGIEVTGEVAIKTAKRTFDIALSVPERLRNVRRAIGKTDDIVSPKVKVGAEAPDVKMPDVERLSFKDNPIVSGVLDDIKIMVGLPDSTPSVDLVFRAIKPSIIKGRNLRRVKAQYALANQTIADKGLAQKIMSSDRALAEYADAIFETKKDVWSQIQSKLDVGQVAGIEIDLRPIAMKILDRAEDSALLRTNPQAVKQLTKIAEDLIRQGDSIDILEAERIKQFLNAELDNAFGAIDLSQQAKEAKKLITRELGVQLDQKLSGLPAEFKDLKIKYGALSSIEDDVLKRVIVFERRNPEGLADILTKTEAAAEIAFGGTKGRLKGIARLTIGKQLKKANDADELVKRAFGKLKPIEKAKKLTKPEVEDVTKVIDSKKGVISQTSNVSSFQSSLGKTTKKYKPFLSTYSDKEYAGMNLFLNKEKTAGYAIKKDGDLVSVFSTGKKGEGKRMVEEAISNGATKLDAFDGYLIENFYPKFGFKEVKRTPWNNKFAPKNWDYDKFGKPDLINMELK